MTENTNASDNVESVEIIETTVVKDDQVVEKAAVEKVTTADQQTKTTVINNYVNPAPATSNTIGLVGFILSLVGLFGSWIPFLGGIAWFIGTILSVIGLFKSPRGFAIAGTIISFIGLIILITMVGLFAVVAAGSY